MVHSWSSPVEATYVCAASPRMVQLEYGHSFPELQDQNLDDIINHFSVTECVHSRTQHARKIHQQGGT